MQTIKQKNKRYEATSTFPQFRANTALIRYVNTKLRTEAKSDVAAFATDIASVKEWGPKDLTWSYSDTTKLYFYSPTRLISLSQTNSAFTGGAHGNYGTSGRNFALLANTTRPRELKLADFFRAGSSYQARIEGLLTSKLNAREASMVERKSVKNLINNFVVQRDGLRWFFPPYSVGSYAEGEFEVKLSFSELGPDFKRALIR